MQNIKTQAILSDALRRARETGIPKPAQDAYCAGYLASKLAAQTEPTENTTRLQQWALRNRDTFFSSLGDLSLIRFTELMGDRAALGAYLIEHLRSEMLYHEPDDADPDHGAEDDMRDRVRDYKLDEIGVC